MNEQVLNNRMSEGMKQNDPSRRPRSSRKKNARRMRLVGGVMMIVGALAMLFCLLLVLLPLFRIQRITVEGSSYYTAEQIIAASRLAEGEELFAADTASTAGYILDECAYVKSVTVRIRFPGTISIVVEEATPSSILYTSFNDGWISFDRHCRVLAQGRDESVFAPFIKAELPPIASMAVGGRITFVDPEADLSHLSALLDLLEGASLRGEITDVDVRSRFHVSFVMNDSCRVVLGKLDLTEQKLLLVNRILEERDPELAQRSVIDVSDVTKSSFRLLSEGEEL